MNAAFCVVSACVGRLGKERVQPWAPDQQGPGPLKEKASLFPVLTFMTGEKRNLS